VNHVVTICSWFALILLFSFLFKWVFVLLGNKKSLIFRLRGTFVLAYLSQYRHVHFAVARKH